MQPQLSKARIDELFGDGVLTSVQAAKWRIIGGILCRHINGTPWCDVAEFHDREFADVAAAVCEMPNLALRCQRSERRVEDDNTSHIETRWCVYRDATVLPDHVDVGNPQHNTLIQSALTDCAGKLGDALEREVHVRYLIDRTGARQGWFTIRPDYNHDIDVDIEKINSIGYTAWKERDETGCPCCWGDLIAVKYRDDVTVPSFSDV